MLRLTQVAAIHSKIPEFIIQKLFAFVLTLFCFSFGQINWEYERVDSESIAMQYSFRYVSLAFDTLWTPHIVYNKADHSKIMFATRTDSIWQIETIDSGLFYHGVSLIYDQNNTAHICYYCKNDSLNKTYLYYAKSTPSGWSTETIDSCPAYFGNYLVDVTSSIAINTLGLPGIAYNIWNPIDSLHYIKYAHYNGAQWIHSTLEYDTIYADTIVMPTDWSPSLAYNSHNIPYICFTQIFMQVDTLKVAHLDTTTNQWIVESVYDQPYGGCPVSLRINKLDRPCIAHGINGSLSYIYWDGSTWHFEYPNVSLGWIGIRIVMDLDSLDNPYICYKTDFSVLGYCYKQNNCWYSDMSLTGNARAWISFSLDKYSNPSICYGYFPETTTYIGLKYAKGTIVGIDESIKKSGNFSPKFSSYPNPFIKEINICLQPLGPHLDQSIIKIYNVYGKLIKNLSNFNNNQTFSYNRLVWRGDDDNNNKVPGGIYFITIKTDKEFIVEKIALLR